ncbi:MAG: hypothetical protein AABX70_02795 [Nanoarchaeota archaeon]
MALVVRCPKCRKSMRCDPRIDITKAIKRCVYCGRYFKIHSTLDKSRIVGRDIRT